MVEVVDMIEKSADYQMGIKPIELSFKNHCRDVIIANVI